MSPWVPELCCDLPQTTVEWLWPRYLARGKLAILDGDPGMGKSLLTIALMARLSRGGAMPDGVMLTRASTCILFSAEDDAADTIRPRAEAACADLSRLVIPNFGPRSAALSGRPPGARGTDPRTRRGTGRDRSLDGVSAAEGRGKPRPVRAAGADAAGGHRGPDRFAILLVRHLTKTGRDRAIHRGQGSMGIVAAVRTAFLVAPHPLDAAARVLTVSKCNVGQPPPALGFRVVESSGQAAIDWLGPVEVTADSVSQTRRLEVVRMRERACDWLLRELANGPRTASDLFAAAAAAGIPERTLERAKDSLDVKSHRHHDREAGVSAWYWYDSSVPWPKDAPFEKPDEFTRFHRLDLL